MNAIFEQLNFKNISKDGYEGWSKIYNGFILFLARIDNSNTPYLASITVGNTEISIPFAISEEWLINFDIENID
jgi:hypothetical protein